MKKKNIIRYFAALLAIILSVAAIVIVAQHTRKPKEIDDAAIIYTNAADATLDIRELELKVSKTLKTQLAAGILSETSDYTISCKNLYSDNLEIAMEETLTVGKHSVKINEVFQNGVIYTELNGGKFYCDTTAEEYEKRLPPAVVINPELYAIITGIDNGDGYLITFSQASGPEVWASQEDITFVGAGGTAFVSYRGELIRSTYTMDYTRQSTRYKMTVTTEIIGKTPVVSVPENAEEYIKIVYSDGPRLLERASGYLTQIDNITAISNDTTYFQAFGDKQVRNITVKTANKSDWTAAVDTVITLTNEGRLGQDSVLQQNETFKNGKYSITTNGGDTITDETITLEDMQTYCHNLLVSTVMLPRDIINCTYKATENMLQITYSANDAFAKQVQANVYSALYQDGDMLAAIQETGKTDTIYCYLELDTATGLPIGSGMLYRCVYTAEGIEYSLEFQADQSYQIEAK